MSEAHKYKSNVQYFQVEGPVAQPGTTLFARAKSVASKNYVLAAQHEISCL